MNLRDNFKSVFDNDYCGADEFIAKVIKPIFGEKDVEVLEPCIENPTHADKDTLLKANIQEILWVAQIDRMGTDPIQVFDITLGDSTNLSRARVGIQRIIRSALFPYSHAFIIFHHRVLTGTEWRFSYVYKQDKNANTTDAKRYTYLFSRELHARTAIDRFEELAKSDKDNEALLTAFNVEALSDEFFEKYRAYYAELVKYITGKEYVKEGGKYVEKSTGKPDAKLYAAFGKDDKAVRDYVKKLMGRITFLHFLQRKGWMNADKNFMLHLFEKSKQKADYMDKVLEPLFFGILNTKPEDRYMLFKESNWDLDLLDEWKSIPYLNGGLFEQETFDCNNSIFPKDYFARLFKFFSEYNFTVDENDPDDAEVGVDPEMLGKIFENLLEDNKDKGAFYTPKEIVRYMCRESLIAYLLEKTGIDETVIREFVTSPYEKEEQMEWADKETILTALENVKICDPAIGSGAFPMGLLNELVRCEEAIVLGQEKNKGRAELKKAIIKNNIYGVDIEKGAIDIARLRFWLSLVVDEEEASPLPNLDYKIMQGNSLLESYKGVDLSHLLDGQDGLLNFGDDTRKSLKDKLDQYYVCEDHTKKRQLQSDINDLVHQQIVDSGRVVKGFESIDVSGNQEFFLWHTWFSDVFNCDEKANSYGFDIIIGNPPYGAKLSETEKSVYRRLFPEIQFKINTYALFVLHAFSLAHNNGHICFILPNTLLDNYFEDRIRKKILDHSLLEVNDLSDKVFENAVVHSMIIRYGNGHVFDSKVQVNTSDSLFGEHFIIPASFFEQQPNYTFEIRTYNNNDILTKLKKDSVRLEDILDIRQAIKTGNDSLYISNKPQGRSYKPILRGKDVQRFCYTFPGLYVNYGKYLACPRDPMIFEQPKILIREAGARITATIDRDNYYIMSSLYNAILKTSDFSIEYLLGLINSRLFQFIMNKLTFEKTKGAFTKAKIFHYYNLPIKKANKEEQKAISDRVKNIMKLASSGVEHTNEENALDDAIFALYGLSKVEIDDILSST